CLSRLIADVSWATLLRFLEYKSTWYGRVLVKVGQYFPSSKRCSKCQYTLKELELKTRNWDCPNCGTQHNRDMNAAKNILSEGLRLLGTDQLKIPWGARDLKPVEFA
ncbi:hypothetical protein SCG7109_AJ_00300, partial [Chlamydiales bacterium SCGC AG-110-M15]